MKGAVPDYGYMSDWEMVTLFNQGCSIDSIMKRLARLENIKPKEARERVEHALITHNKGELLY